MIEPTYTLPSSLDTTPSTRIFLLTEDGTEPVQLGSIESFEVSRVDGEGGIVECRWHLTGFPHLPEEGRFQLIVATQVTTLTHVVYVKGCRRDSFHLHSDKHTTQVEISGSYVDHSVLYLRSEDLSTALHESLQHAIGLGH